MWSPAQVVSLFVSSLDEILGHRTSLSMSVVTRRKEFEDSLCLGVHRWCSTYKRLKLAARFVAQDAILLMLNVVLGDGFLTIAQRLVDVGGSTVQLTLKR